MGAARRGAGAVALAVVFAAGTYAGTPGPTAAPEPPPPTAANTTQPEPSTSTTTPTTTAPIATSAAPPPGGVAGRTTAPCMAPVRAEPATDRPAYTVRVRLDPGARRATGESTAHFTPDLATNRLVLRLWPNSPVVRPRGGSMSLDTVLVDGGSVVPQVASDDPTLVTLPVAVPAGRRVTIETTWTITLAVDVAERWSVARGAVRLGSFVPLLPWERGSGWATERATSLHGEATTSGVADWDLRIDAGGLDVVATGVQVEPGRFRSSTVRDVGLTAGRFRRAEQTAQAGPGGAAVPVIVVADQAVADEPGPYARKVVAALESFAARFGPYPYPVYTLALTASMKGGIEHPMFVMQGPGSIGRSTSHEIAHQWFYGLVGNDQARDPWLDEGLATWAEAGYEGTLASMRATSIPADARGRAGEDVGFWASRSSSYYRGVYIQPTQALAALGPPSAVDCVVARWTAEQAHRIAIPASLTTLLVEAFPGARATLSRYGL